MDICSPKDGFVTKIHVADKAKVSAKTVLIELDILTEVRDEGRLHAISDARELIATQFDSPDADVLLRLANAGITIATAKRDQAKREIDDHLSEANKAGVQSNKALKDAQDDLKSADASIEKAQAQYDLLKTIIDRHQKLNLIGRKLTTTEQTFLDTRKSLMMISAPISGTVRFHVAEGSFAKLGKPLATIE